MLRFYCIRQYLFIGLSVFLYQGVSRAETPHTYLGCLTQGDFAACVEAGPLSAKMVGDIRRALDEAEDRVAAGGNEGQWSLYAVRFAERDFLERVRQTFDLTHRSVSRLPAPVREAVNEMAVRMARITGGAPNPALEEVWTDETRATLAALLPAKVEAVAEIVPVDESEVIGKRFVTVFATASEAAAPLSPASADQYTRIGLYQLQATQCLLDRPDSARAAELHDELVAWADELQARGEEASPDIQALRANLLDGMLAAGA